MTLSSVLLQKELHCRHGAFHGQKNHSLWGGIPLVIIFGDTYQTAFFIEPNILYCCDTEPPKNITITAGQKLFGELAQNVRELNSFKRQLVHEDQTYFKELL
jgi:hypothetical protein